MPKNKIEHYPSGASVVRAADHLQNVPLPLDFVQTYLSRPASAYEGRRPPTIKEWRERYSNEDPSILKMFPELQFAWAIATIEGKFIMAQQTYVRKHWEARRELAEQYNRSIRGMPRMLPVEIPPQDFETLMAPRVRHVQTQFPEYGIGMGHAQKFCFAPPTRISHSAPVKLAAYETTATLLSQMLIPVPPVTRTSTVSNNSQSTSQSKKTNTTTSTTSTNSPDTSSQSDSQSITIIETPTMKVTATASAMASAMASSLNTPSGDQCTDASTSTSASSEVPQLSLADGTEEIDVGTEPEWNPAETPPSIFPCPLSRNVPKPVTLAPASPLREWTHRSLTGSLAHLSPAFRPWEWRPPSQNSPFAESPLQDPWWDVPTYSMEDRLYSSFMSQGPR